MWLKEILFMDGGNLGRLINWRIRKLHFFSELTFQ